MQWNVLFTAEQYFSTQLYCKRDYKAFFGTTLWLQKKIEESQKYEKDGEKGLKVFFQWKNKLYIGGPSHKTYKSKKMKDHILVRCLSYNKGCRHWFKIRRLSHNNPKHDYQNYEVIHYNGNPHIDEHCIIQE